MGPVRRGFHAGAHNGQPRDAAHGAGSEGLGRGDAAEEHRAVLSPWASADDVCEQSVANLLRQRELRGATILSRHADGPLLPVDVAELKSSDIAGPKGQPREEE